MWPPGVHMGWSHGGQAAALDLLKMLCAQRSYVRGQAPPAHLSAPQAAPCSVGAVPRPWLGGSRAVFSRQHSWNRQLGWALGSCPATPGNVPFPHCFCCCCCLADYLRHETTTSFLLLSSYVVWELDSGSSPLGCLVGVDGAGGALAKASSPCTHICWLVLAGLSAVSLTGTPTWTPCGWASSGHGGWVSRMNVPRENQWKLCSNPASEVTQCHFC